MPFKMSRKTTLADYLDRFRAVHGDIYEYLEKFEENGKPVVRIRCKVHGEFVQTTSNHSNGKGCNKCGYARRGRSEPYTLETFTAKAREVHGDRYEYLELVRGSGSPSVKISCRYHGEFVQKVYNHLQGKGCLSCRNKSNQLDSVEISRRFRKLHGNASKLLEVDQTCTVATISARCNRHAIEYTQTVFGCLQGYQGCRLCSGDTSRGSWTGLDLYKFVKDLRPDAEVEYTIPGTKQRLDIFIPSLSLGIELDGVYWHSEKFKDRQYHRQKQLYAKSSGIRTVHIYDSEWLNTTDSSPIRKFLRRLLGAPSTSVGARKTTVCEVEASEAKTFLESNHVQGFSAASYHVGLRLGDELLAVMSLQAREAGRSGRRSSTSAELVRYATSLTLPGGFTKLLSYVLLTRPALETIRTFSDNRMFSGDLYSKSGFVRVKELDVDYKYAKGNVVYPKRSLQKSRFKRPDMLYQESLTELELAKLNGFHRLWDCGKVLWEYRR